MNEIADDETQKVFIRHYLEEMVKIEGKDPNSVTMEDVENFFDKSQKAALVSFVFFSFFFLSKI